MDPLAVFAVLLGLVVFATVIGLIWRARTGRVRGVSKDETVITLSELSETAVGGSGATLLQFSTEVCAPCVRTHAILGTIAAETPRVSHVDIDVTRRPDIASRFNLLQSPTTLILDARGVVRARIGGAPRKADVAAELQRILGTTTSVA